jgi:hypothetical protein
MQAAVVPAVNRAWQVKEVPQPQPGPNQVLVKMHASGICPSSEVLVGDSSTLKEEFITVTPLYPERVYFKYDLTISITSSAAATCFEVGFCFPLRTWLRIWPSRSSAIKLFIAPLAALITCKTSEQSRSSSKARTKASTCPRIRLALRSRFCFSLIVWLIVSIICPQDTIPGMVV